MSWYSLVPVVVLSLTTVLAARSAGLLHPATAARVLVVLLVATGISSVGAVAMLAVGFVTARVESFDPAGHVVGLLVAHGSRSWVVGLSAATALVVVAGLAARSCWRLRRAHHLAPSGAGLVIVDAAEPTAFAVGGRRPRIVISKSLVDLLPRRELAVVIHHERSHLRHRHESFVVLGTCATYAAPWLRSPARTLQFALERWADEDAADALGDRRLVANAIARAALLSAAPAAVRAFTGGEVEARVRAMLAAPPATSTMSEKVVLVGTTAATTGVTGSALQLHHALHWFG